MAAKRKHSSKVTKEGRRPLPPLVRRFAALSREDQRRYFDIQQTIEKALSPAPPASPPTAEEIINNTSFKELLEREASHDDILKLRPERSRELVRFVLQDVTNIILESGLHASLIRGRLDDELPNYVCGETIEWHSPQQLQNLTDQLLDRVDFLGRLLGVATNVYADAKDDTVTPFLQSRPAAKVEQTTSGE